MQNRKGFPLRGIYVTSCAGFCAIKTGGPVRTKKKKKKRRFLQTPPSDTSAAGENSVGSGRKKKGYAQNECSVGSGAVILHPEGKGTGRGKKQKVKATEGRGYERAGENSCMQGAV